MLFSMLKYDLYAKEINAILHAKMLFFMLKKFFLMLKYVLCAKNTKCYFVC